MKYLLIRTTLIVMAVCVSVLLGVSTAAWAQDSIEQGAAKMQSAAKIRSEVQLKTLDDLRRLGTSDIFKKVVVQSAEISGGGKPVSGQVTIEKKLIPAEIKKVAVDAIRAQQHKLSEPGVKRADAEQSLQVALTEYFFLDMLQSVKELDEIKAKVGETEAKLQKRLESQKEAIDLQMQIMIHEADGLGFFGTSNAAGSSTEIQPGSPDMLALAASSYGAQNAQGNLGELGSSVAVAATYEALKKTLSTTQTLTLVVDDNFWNHHRLPTSFDDEAFGKLAAAILKALGPTTDSKKSLLWNKSSATLEVRFSNAQYEELGSRIPDVMEKLKESSDARQKQKNEATTAQLLGR